MFPTICDDATCPLGFKNKLKHFSQTVVKQQQIPGVVVYSQSRGNKIQERHISVGVNEWLMVGTWLGC
jgi:hypothetical protein